MISEFIAMFRTPDAKALAQNMLAEAQVQLLKHQQNADYHTKIAEYHQQTINRLETSCLPPSNTSLADSSTVNPLTKALRSRLYATPASSQ